MNLTSGWPGAFIVFEGIDGCGKTTQVDILVAKLKLKFGEDRVVYSKDLGGSKLGTLLRNIMYMEVPTKDLAPGVADLLFLAGHVQNWETIVRPALYAGKVVVSDRWFYSEFAYGPFRGSPKPTLEVYSAMCGESADLLVFLNGDPTILFERANGRTDADDHQHQKAWNSLETQRKISKSYCDQYDTSPEWCQIEIDRRSIAEIAMAVDSKVDELLCLKKIQVQHQSPE